MFIIKGIEYILWIICLGGLLPNCYGLLFGRRWTPWKRYEGILFEEDDSVEYPVLVALYPHSMVDIYSSRKKAKLLKNFISRTKKTIKHMPEVFLSMTDARGIFTHNSDTEDIEERLLVSSTIQFLLYPRDIPELSEELMLGELRILNDNGLENWTLLMYAFYRFLNRRLAFNVFIHGKDKKESVKCSGEIYNCWHGDYLCQNTFFIEGMSRCPECGVRHPSHAIELPEYDEDEWDDIDEYNEEMERLLRKKMDPEEFTKNCELFRKYFYKYVKVFE